MLTKYHMVPSFWLFYRLIRFYISLIVYILGRLSSQVKSDNPPFPPCLCILRKDKGISGIQVLLNLLNQMARKLRTAPCEGISCDLSFLKKETRGKGFTGLCKLVCKIANICHMLYHSFESKSLAGGYSDVLSLCAECGMFNSVFGNWGALVSKFIYFFISY